MKAVWLSGWRYEKSCCIRPEKDQSGKSEGVTGHALPAVWIPDSTGRTAPNQYRSSALPEVRSHFHRKPVFDSYLRLEHNSLTLAMAKSHQRVTRVLGYQPLRLSSGVKRAAWSAILAVPSAMTATGISDSKLVSNGFRYVFSPGIMLAIRFVRVEPSHRGLGVFLDVMNWYGRTMSFALMVNAIFYGFLIFGIMTTISGAKAGAR